MAFRNVAPVTLLLALACATPPRPFSGASDRYAFLREVAFTMAFVFTQLGLEY